MRLLSAAVITLLVAWLSVLTSGLAPAGATPAPRSPVASPTAPDVPPAAPDTTSVTGEESPDTEPDAEPGAASDELTSEVEELKAEVERLELASALAVEEYNTAQDELSELVADELVAQHALSEARQRLERDRADAARRVRALYRSGGTDSWQLHAWQGADLSAAAEAGRLAEHVLAHDSAVVDRARSQLAEVTALSQQVQVRRAAAMAATERAQLGRQQAETAVRAAEQLLARTDAQLVAALEQERRAAESAALAAALPSWGVSRTGSAGDRGGDSAELFAGDAELVITRAIQRAPSAQAGGAIGHAAAELGAPYRWGAVGPESFDCSGLTTTAYAGAGVSIGRTSRQQFVGSPPVPVSEAAPGDLVFYARGPDVASIHHVGLYLGDGVMIHAPRTGDVVRVSAVAWSRVIGIVRPAP